MKPPAEAKRGLCRTALQVLEWQFPYPALDYVFRLIEQNKTGLQDLLANEGRGQ
jgi:hypothetical protein